MNNFKINDQLRITNLQQKTKNKLPLEQRKLYPIPVVKRYPSRQKYLAMQLLNPYIKSLLQCMTMMHEKQLIMYSLDLCTSCPTIFMAHESFREALYFAELQQVTYLHHNYLARALRARTPYVPSICLIM